MAFRREKYVPRGGPAGGDGGDGGSVYLQASPHANSLLDWYYRPHQRAGDGGRGQPKDCHGKTGADLVMDVPCGTVAWDADSGDRIGEVVQEGERLLLAQGGKKGLGNKRFVTSTNQAPREYTPGTPGEARTINLELKLVADAGLVGYPNAGKSTLLSRLTHAKPKVAAYPFTTLNPVIGVLQTATYQTVKIADIPGLVEGAHTGVGLGHDFLRHIERTRFLLLVLDMAGVDGRDPVEDYHGLLHELAAYNPQLKDRPRIVVANKMDLPAAAEQLQAFKQATGLDPIPISAQDDQGIDAVRKELCSLIFPWAKR